MSDFIMLQRHTPLENGFGGVRRWHGWRQGLSGRGEEGSVVAEQEVLVEREPLDAAIRLRSDRAAELLDERELRGLVRALEDWAARPQFGHYAASAPHVDCWPVVALAYAQYAVVLSTPPDRSIGLFWQRYEYKSCAPRRSSGGRYQSVITRFVYLFGWSGIDTLNGRDSPKSASFKMPVRVMSTFEVFTSRWRILFLLQVTITGFQYKQKQKQKQKTKTNNKTNKQE